MIGNGNKQIMVSNGFDQHYSTMGITPEGPHSNTNIGMQASASATASSNRNSINLQNLQNNPYQNNNKSMPNSKF
jgi:hypothetical protein